MYTFDASSLIHAWDNYPIENFPPLWKWFADQIDQDLFSTPKIALEEVLQKSPECGEWLKKKAMSPLNIENYPEPH